MDQVTLGKTKLRISRLGYGAFKIGRNQGVKYPDSYELPDEQQVDELLRAIYLMGINYFDTAPAYGTSEELLGKTLPSLGDDVVVSTKVGEEFIRGESVYKFDRDSVRRSVERSLRHLGRDTLDLVLIHSSHDDLRVLRETEVVATLHALKDEGIIRHVGFSGYTAEAYRSALEWAEVVMVEYNPMNAALAPVIDQARERGAGVIIKKGFASGHANPAEAIPAILSTPGVSSLLVTSLNEKHMRANCDLAGQS